MGKTNKILAMLDKEGLEMNEENFKICLAKNVRKTELTSSGSLINYYDSIKNFFMLKFSQEL